MFVAEPPPTLPSPPPSHAQTGLETKGKIYAISSLAALCFNLLTLFMGTFFSLVLSMIPFQCVRKFVWTAALSRLHHY